MKDTMRIYYNEQCIHFAADANSLLEKEQIRNAWIVRNDWEVERLFLKFTQLKFENLILEGPPTALFDKFLSNFVLIVAGGGVVWNEQDELLMIHRLGKWDLPKGKIEAEEKIEEGALREVEEETGLAEITLKEHLKTSYHIYNYKKQWIVKQTEWYNMTASKQSLTPQAEEDISEATWVAKKEVPEKLTNSYPNIVFLLHGLI